MMRRGLAAGAVATYVTGVLQATFSVAAALPPASAPLAWLGSVIGVLMVGCAVWMWRYSNG